MRCLAIPQGPLGELQQLVERRRQLIDIRTAESNRLQQTLSKITKVGSTEPPGDRRSGGGCSLQRRQRTSRWRPLHFRGTCDGAEHALYGRAQREAIQPLNTMVKNNTPWNAKLAPVESNDRRWEKRKRALLRSNSPRNIPVQCASMTPAVLRVRTEGGPEFMERIGHALKTYLHPPPTPSSPVGIRRADVFHPNPKFPPPCP